MPKRWMGLMRSSEKQKLTREASTSMEDLTYKFSSAPGAVNRPKSMCVPDISRLYQQIDDGNNFDNYTQQDNNKYYETNFSNENNTRTNNNRLPQQNQSAGIMLPRFSRQQNVQQQRNSTESSKPKIRRNPVQRAASRLYRAGLDIPKYHGSAAQVRDCVGPEFVVRAALPRKEIIMSAVKGSAKKTVTVIMLNGQKIDVICNPSTTTAGQLFEVNIIVAYSYSFDA